MLSITTKDNQVVTVTQDIRNMSKMIDEALMDDSSEQAELKVSDVNKKELDLIVEYATHYEFKKLKSDIKQPLISKNPKDFITDDWEREFIEKLDLDA